MSNPHTLLFNRLVIFSPSRERTLTSLMSELNAHGVTTFSASDITEGLHFLHQLSPDHYSTTAVLILESLGKIGVFAAANAIRSLPNCTTIPLIVLESFPQRLSNCRRFDAPLQANDLYQVLATHPSTWNSQHPLSERHVSNEASSDCILVVDDSPVNLRMLRLQTESLGFHVDTCEDGEQAIARIAAGGIRLVLMDCHMPIMDGYEATSIIRQQEATTNRHLPIIAVTANSLLSNRERCFSIGMDDFLLKPVSIERLREVFRQWLTSP